MYHLEQEKFLNAACRIETTLSHKDLLTELQTIEKEMGRIYNFRNGPRVIDIDILFYDNLCFKSEHLEIPHPRISERVFVLKPLCDIQRDFIHPVFQCTIESLYDSLPSSEKTSLVKVIPCVNQETGVAKYIKLQPMRPVYMGILNMTPDR